MNILKEFEAVFVVAVGVAASAMLLSQGPAQASAPSLQAQSAVATPSKMAVVTVSAKRMSSAEKQRSLEDERRLARQGNAAADRI